MKITTKRLAVLRQLAIAGIITTSTSVMAVAPTSITEEKNAAVRQKLPFYNQQDFEDARRGFIAGLPDGIIKNAEGRSVWDLNQYQFLEADSPASANPSLWRQAQLNNIAGLFEVTQGIYQVRSFGLANLTVVATDNGWLVIDTMLNRETAKAAMDLIDQQLGKRPVKAVIYTHSHADHFGGVRGVVDEADVISGKVPIIAPEGFMEHALSENVYAGNAMSRRASYMFGNLLPKNAQGNIDTGLGKTTESGSLTLLRPTKTISTTGEQMVIDGLEVVFQNTPGAEAPAEMMFYFPKYKALCTGENATRTLHNLYTLRGAKVRDARAWSHYLDEAVEMFGDRTEILFATHHWPTWGQQRVDKYLKQQRDVYKYIHDQTLRLANQGYTASEIAEQIELPASLAETFGNRGYYGSVSHNVKAVYQFYLGWFDANPANLNPLPPQDAGKKYVEYMGGADNILDKARESYQQGEYRWVAMVLNHLVFAEPQNQAAKQLLADNYAQLGYQAESAPWRNFYLTGAQELRSGVKALPTPNTSSPDLVNAMSTETFLDYLAIQLNSEKAEGHSSSFLFNFSDSGESYLLTLENSVLNHRKAARTNPAVGTNPAVSTINMTREALNQVILKQASIPALMETGDIQVSGDEQAFLSFLGMLDSFEFWFNIVTP